LALFLFSHCHPLPHPLLHRKLQLIQSVVNPTKRQQFRMRAHLANLAFVQHDDAIHVLDGGEAVRDDDELLFSRIKFFRLRMSCSSITLQV
jgi:hypothetical protein